VPTSALLLAKISKYTGIRNGPLMVLSAHRGRQNFSSVEFNKKFASPLPSHAARPDTTGVPDTAWLISVTLAVIGRPSTYSSVRCCRQSRRRFWCRRQISASASVASSTFHGEGWNNGGEWRNLATMRPRDWMTWISVSAACRIRSSSPGTSAGYVRAQIPYAVWNLVRPGEGQPI